MDEIKTSKNKKMKKELKDYLHLYLGCECKGEDGSMIYTLIDVGLERSALLLDKFGNECVIFDFKPILRPLSDMTKKESGITDEILNLFDGENAFAAMQGMANITLYLLRAGFDVFGLIESGLALDATLIQNTGTSPTK